jgi:hypothetical protein
LQKSLIGPFLHLDQVRNLDARLDFGEIQALALAESVASILHAGLPLILSVSCITRIGRAAAEDYVDVRPPSFGRTPLPGHT